MDIRQNIKTYLDKREADERYASFDYCYNYFYSFRKKSGELAYRRNIEKSCLHLGFFLASWGMYRNPVLLNKSAKHYERLIEKVIAGAHSNDYWKIDVDKYNEKNIKALLDLKKEISGALGNNPSDTLVTKIMLGVFGNVPAFDRNFRKGMGKQKVNTFNETSLKRIGQFYTDHRSEFNRKIPTFDFSTGGKTKIMYTKAKLIDMAAFQEGLRKK